MRKKYNHIHNNYGNKKKDDIQIRLKILKTILTITITIIIIVMTMIITIYVQANNNTLVKMITYVGKRENSAVIFYFLSPSWTTETTFTLLLPGTSK